jgi:hypothetical protein
VQFASLSETLKFKWHVQSFMLYFVRLSSVVYPTHKLELSGNEKLTKIFEPRDDKSRQFRMYNNLFGVCSSHYVVGVLKYVKLKQI